LHLPLDSGADDVVQNRTRRRRLLATLQKNGVATAHCQGGDLRLMCCYERESNDKM
jgi:hypothetical protein